MAEETLALDVVVSGFNQFSADMSSMEKFVDSLTFEIQQLTEVSKELTSALTKTESEVEDAADATGKADSKVDGLGDSFDKSEKKAEGFGKTIRDSVSVALGNIMAKAAEVAVSALVDLTQNMVGLGISAVESAISVESAFAGVTKTTDGLVDDMGNLSEAGKELKGDFMDLTKEIPATFEELAEIGELGGQLGVQKENLIDFTTTIAQLGETTNLANEEAASSFAQIANVMGTAQTEYSRMGSSVVALGNNMATTEKDVVSFAQRIMGAGAVVGLTEADIFGIGAAFTSLGVNVEAGGTAVQKVLLSMNESVLEGGDNLEIFAAVAGQSAEEFGAAWQEDAAGQFTKFVQGLGVAGDDAVGILKELGLEDQRLISSFLSAASAEGVLTDGIKIANDAWEENTALQNEAAQRFGTTESQIKLMENRFKAIGATIGDAVLPILGQLLDSMTMMFEIIGPEIERTLERISPLFETLSERIKWVFDDLSDLILGGMGWRDFVSNDLEPAVENIIIAFQSFVGILGVLTEDIGAFVAGALARFGEWFEENDELILEFIGVIVDGFKEGAASIKKFWQLVKPVLEALGELLLDIFTLIMQIVVGDWEGAWETIQQIVADAWQAIQEMFVFFTEWVASWFNSDVAEIRAMWRDNWEQFKTILGLAWDAMITAISGKLGEMKDKVVEGINAIGQWITDNFQKFIDWGSDIITKIAQGISDNASKIIDKVKSAIDGIGQAIRDKGQALLDFGSSIAGKIGEGISNASGAISDTIGGILAGLGSAITFTTEVINSIASIGTRIVNFIVNGITGGVSSIIDAISGMIQSAIENFFSGFSFPIPGGGGGGDQPSIQSVTGGGASVFATGSASSAPSSVTTNNFNLTTQSFTRPDTLAMEFEAMSMATR